MNNTKSPKNVSLKNQLELWLFCALIGAVAGALVWILLKIMAVGTEFLWKWLPGKASVPYYTILICVACAAIIGIFRKIFGDTAVRCRRLTYAALRRFPPETNGLWTSLPSRALLVMGCSGNRLSNRPAAAPVQAKGPCASTDKEVRIPTTSLRLMLTVVSSGFLLRHCQASAHTGCGDPSPTVEQQASSTTQ